MNASQIEKAVTTRARVRISKNNGWAAGVEGIALGFRNLYGNIKVGFIDADGDYTGEYTMVSHESVELITDEVVDAETREQATDKVRAMAAKLTDEALCLAWMGTEGKPVTQELAMVRGWMMDELNERLGDDLFDEWLAGDENGDTLNPLAYLANRVAGGRENAERPVAVYGIETGTPLHWLSTVEAQDAAVMHFRRGATIHEYDTTDRNGAPLHVVIATTADQGTVYEFPETPAAVSTASSPQATAPERQIAPPAPTGAYATALKECRAKGYAHAPSDALLAGLCEDVIQALVGAVSPQLVWEGAMKKGLTAKELLSLCHTDFMAVDGLQWL